LREKFPLRKDEREGNIPRSRASSNTMIPDCVPLKKCIALERRATSEAYNVMKLQREERNREVPSYMRSSSGWFLKPNLENRVGPIYMNHGLSPMLVRRTASSLKNPKTIEAQYRDGFTIKLPRVEGTQRSNNN